MSSIENPINKSPPIVQLGLLITLNTFLFIATAFIQKMFSVDVLRYVCSVTGANPMDIGPGPVGMWTPAHPTTGAAPPPSTAAPKGPMASAFAAFTQNF